MGKNWTGKRTEKETLNPEAAGVHQERTLKGEVTSYD
jgi:hypothetical protein